MSDTHDLLPIAWGLDVPAPVSETLVDLGIACNEAALALDQAHLHHRSAISACDAAEADGPTAQHRWQFARDWCDCAVSYTDQLTAVYTRTAAVFAAYAVRVVGAFAKDGEFPSVDPHPIQPSHVLSALDEHLPLVQMPVLATAPVSIAEHNTELATQHQGLTVVVDLTVMSHPVDVYDDPSRLALRPADSVRLGGNLAHALHGYAAACAWAVGLATRPQVA
jgi:hypothetical protein